MGFLDKTLPICYKEYCEKAEGDRVCMGVILSLTIIPELHFAVYGNQLPL